MPQTAFRLLPVAALVFSSSLRADTIRVPGDYSSIQEAIAHASDGDTVLVAPGRYVENIDFLGKGIVVVSERGPAVTTIDGGLSGSTVRFSSGEGPDSVLEGFTVTNGSGTASGPYTYGGGVYCYFSSPSVRSNIIAGNQVNFSGGGVYCLFADSLVLAENTIRENAAQDGGGIFVSSSSHPLIERNIVRGNFAELRGGGIYLNWESSPDLSCNTLTGNEAGYVGGGIYSYGSSFTLTNSILREDDAPEGPEIYLADWLFPSELTVSYSDVAGGEAGAGVEPECILSWGPGNIDADPLFALPDLDDHRLLWGSPCIDTGDPAASDPDGSRSDMGALSFDQGDYLTLYLTPQKARVPEGSELTVTYTLTNRWQVPVTFSLRTWIILPGGGSIDLMGPSEYTLPAEYTSQIPVVHRVPRGTPPLVYEYGSGASSPLLAAYGQDSFTFRVVRRTSAVPIP